MPQLIIGTLLQGGKYKIERVLGQGGFGITYLAIQSGLNRKVCVKEFYMKDHCYRDESTATVTLSRPSFGSEVARIFMEKFLKEARNIAKLNHPNIVKIIDVFEENGTAYYVMEYANGGSLADKVKKEGSLSEETATRYIIQVAEALSYVHERKMNHLDVKPANIMLNDKDEAILIDFGLSKQYDGGGQQTSTTPVGISEGYAPMEQYNQGGVKEFSPETDIYALGATFFYLLTGSRPASASQINEEGIPIDLLKRKKIKKQTISLICNAMEAKRKDRTNSISDFVVPLNRTEKHNSKTWLYGIALIAIFVLLGIGWGKWDLGTTDDNAKEPTAKEQITNDEVQQVSTSDKDMDTQKDTPTKEKTGGTVEEKTIIHEQTKNDKVNKSATSSISFSFGNYSGPDDGEGNGNRGVIQITSSYTLSTNGGNLDLQPGDEIHNTQIRSGILKSGVWIHNGERTSFFR